MIRKLRVLVPKLRALLNDAALVAGLSLICLGLAKIYKPLGYMSAGAILVVFALSPKRNTE